MQHEITVRENLHDYECQDCFGHELDVHGRCAGCGSEAVALIFRPITEPDHVCRSPEFVPLQSLQSGRTIRI